MINILTSAPTTEPPSPGVAASGKIDHCFLASGPRIVCDTLVAAATADTVPYRWSEDLAKWVPSVAGAVTLPVGAGELRIEDGAGPAYRCLVRTGGTGTGTYSARSGR